MVRPVAQSVPPDARRVRVIAVLVLVFAFGAAVFSGAPLENPWIALWMALLIPCIWLVLASVLSTTWLFVEPERVRWYLWKGILLGTYPVGSLKRLDTGSFAALLIRTDAGTIRMLGLYEPDRRKLIEHLCSLNPRIIGKSRAF